MIHSIAYFDAHCDTVGRCVQIGRDMAQNDGHLDLDRLGRFEKAAQVFAIFENRDRFAPGTLFDQCRRQRDLFAQAMETYADRVVQCRVPGDVAAANTAGKIAALLSVEGGELLNCDPGLLETAHEWGVRMINITWNHANDLSGSHMDEPARGLGHLGKVFVQEANRRGILMDVSHLSDQGFWDLERLTALPLVASHSNARAICPHTRNVTDDMFRAIRDSGGVVGMNMYEDFIGGDHTLEALIRHIDHFMELDGAKTVALGGDWDGCDLACGWKDITDLPALWSALAERGYDRQTLEDIFYNNLLRVLG